MYVIPEEGKKGLGMFPKVCYARYQPRETLCEFCTQRMLPNSPNWRHVSLTPDLAFLKVDF